MRYYLAIDIGASSGRHILGWVEDGLIRCREVYRFPNQMTARSVGGRETLCWDAEALFAHILAGLRVCKEAGTAPGSVALDTWGVDFRLLDADGAPVGEMVAYRDHRTDGMDAVCESIVPFAELYARTGIQKQSFNTVYQLLALQRAAPEQLDAARTLLFTPDYFSYRLTGCRRQEYTIASTSGLLDAGARTWDYELLRKQHLPERLFGPLSRPGECVGPLSDAVAAEVGFTCDVVLAPSHDTASAYLATPVEGAGAATLSSGTWSLLGVELDAPLLNGDACRANFTNEGGADGGIRFLRNIMGLWMVQSVRREQAPELSYGELETLARAAADFPSVVDAGSGRFLSPGSMTKEIRAACRETGQPEPETVGQYIRCVYAGLAQCYRDALRELETITGQRFTTLHIVGGGSKSDYLNELTAEVTGLRVLAGPEEGTALGNLMSQMLADGALPNLPAARAALRRSFPPRVYGG